MRALQVRVMARVLERVVPVPVGPQSKPMSLEKQRTRTRTRAMIHRGRIKTMPIALLER